MSANIEEYLDLLEKAEKRNLIAHGRKFYSTSFPEKKVRIDDVINERERIKNDDLKQNIRLKSIISAFLCLLLYAETIVVFVFSLFQAIEVRIEWPIFGTQPFHLDEWSFKLLVTATIAQITIMLRIVVKYLFPNQK